MVRSLGFVAVVVTSYVVSVLSSDGSGDCTIGKRTLHEFTDKSLVGDQVISFAQNKNEIVIITNVATF